MNTGRSKTVIRYLLKINTICLVTALISVLTASTLSILPASAQLNQTQIEKLRAPMNKALNEIQTNSTSTPTNLQQAIQILKQWICNMPVGCPHPGSIQSSQADIFRRPLNDALEAIQSGNSTVVRELVIKANQSLPDLSK